MLTALYSPCENQYFTIMMALHPGKRIKHGLWEIFTSRTQR